MVMVPDTIAYDGSEDVAAELTTWLESNKSNTTVTFQPNGIYRINDGPVKVVGASNLVIDGNGATLQRTDVPPVAYRFPSLNHSSSLLMDRFARNVTIRNLNVVGVNDATTSYLNTFADATGGGGLAEFYENDGVTLNEADPPGMTPLSDWGTYCLSFAFDHAIEITAGRRVIVEDCTMTGVFGDGVLFNPGCDGAIVRRCTMERVGRQGAAWSSGTNILFDSNTVLSARQAAIDLECDDASQTISNVEISNNYFNSWLTSFAAIGPGAINDIWYHHNTVWRNAIIVGTNSGAIQRYRWRFEDNILNKQVIDTGTGWETTSDYGVINMEAYTDVGVRRNRYKTAGANQNFFKVRDGCTNVYVESNWAENVVDVAFAGGGDPSTWTEANNVTGATTAPSPTPSVLDSTGTLNEIRNVGGNLFKWDGSAWKFNGKEFAYFPPLVDWSA